MRVINYYNNEAILNESTGEKERKIVHLEYPVYIESECDKWFDIIEKTYGKYGEVTVEEKEDDRPPSPEKIMNEQLASLLIENKKKDEINKQLANQIASLSIEINKLKG